MRNFKKMDAHERKMNRHSNVFWTLFVVITLVIVSYWCFIGFAAVKTFGCMGDSKCLEDMGRNMGTVMKGFKEASRQAD